MQGLLVSYLLVGAAAAATAATAKVEAKVAVKKRDGPVETDTVVPKADWASYDNCPEPPCSAPCANVQGFHIVMCESYTCNECASPWCEKTCQKWQEQYPTCRCPDWPASRTSYSSGE